jgi:type VI secretion system protein ImpJ
MAESASLCRVDWKLGQALMPDHFLWQEDSLRREWEQRSLHQALPMWGVVDLAWDEALLATSGRLLITRLELVFETGVLVDVPGNARPVSLELPKPETQPIDLYLHLDSEPEVIKGGWSDGEGSLIELRMQKLVLATEPLRTPLPGFHLLRLRPNSIDAPSRPKEKATGWKIDPAYTPPLVSLFSLREFGLRRFENLNRALIRWKDKLRAHAVENALGVHKRVQASLYLRQAQGLTWYLRQVSPALTEQALASDERARQGTPSKIPSIHVHPFELFTQLVALYLDVFAFRCGPLQTIQREEPAAFLYDHEALSQCFEAIEAAIEKELSRPGAASPEWSFSRDAQHPDRQICKLPEGLSADCELYFLVQLGGDPEEIEAGSDGLDVRLSGLKLAAPERLEPIQRRVLPGIPLERVRLLPFPHDFDPNTVQFYRIKHGPEWRWAHEAGAISYCHGGRKIQRSFLYSPEVRG